MSMPIILSIIVGLLVLFLLVFVILWRKNQPEKLEPNYRLFFILGITWLPIGIALDNMGLWGMGIVFMALGLANRKKWGEETIWNDLTPEQRKYKLFIMVGLLLVLMVGVLAFLFVGRAG